MKNRKQDCYHHRHLKHHLRMAEECFCSVSAISRFLYPSLLLILSERESYGYDIIGRLGEVGYTEQAPDPATVYRVLRKLESDGAVKSEWDTSGSGPAKRVYSITPEGVEILRAWAVSIGRTKESLEKFLEVFRKRFGDVLRR